MLNIEAAQRAAGAAERRALEASLSAHLDAVNALLDPHERLDCLVIVTQPWTVESGLITPTFKVRRNRIEDVYAMNYERWVVQRRTVIWHDYVS
jgi:long-chain acyl-CoA synthetase